jgi:hypothetical protein
MQVQTIILFPQIFDNLAKVVNFSWRITHIYKKNMFFPAVLASSNECWSGIERLAPNINTHINFPIFRTLLGWRVLAFF